jgi:hypothetical protein
MGREESAPNPYFWAYVQINTATIGELFTARAAARWGANRDAGGPVDRSHVAMAGCVEQR